MRVLITSHVWEPEVGVPQRRWAWLTKTLVEAGHEVDVVAPPPHYPTGKLQTQERSERSWQNGPGRNGEHIWRTTFVPHDRGLLGRICNEAVAMVAGLSVAHRRIRHQRPDVLVATAPPLPTTVTAALLGRIHKIPVLIDLRDTWPDLLGHVVASRGPSGKPEGRFLKGLVLRALSAVGRRLINWSLRQAAGVVTTSETFAELLLERGVRRTICVLNVANLPDAPLPPPPEQSRTLHVLYAGTTGRAQELASALRAVAEARKAGTDIRLRIIGGGAHMRTLRKNARRLDLPVEFLKRVPPAEMRPHYEWADSVLVQLQSWPALSAAIPSKIFEVMAYERHITGSLNGEAAQIITEAEAGHCVPAQDEAALKDLLINLQRDRSWLMVGGNGGRWLEQNADPVELQTRFLRFVDELAAVHG